MRCVLIALCLAAGCAADAGPPRWHRGPLRLCALEGVDADTLLAAAGAWEPYTLGMAMVDGGCDVEVLWGRPISTGATQVRLDDGAIVFARIWLHRDKPIGDAADDPDALDLQTILTHEVGHALGIEHSDDPRAVMYEHVLPGEVRRELTADDVDAVHALYAW